MLTIVAIFFARGSVWGLRWGGGCMGVEVRWGLGEARSNGIFQMITRTSANFRSLDNYAVTLPQGQNVKLMEKIIYLQYYGLPFFTVSVRFWYYRLLVSVL